MNEIEQRLHFMTEVGLGYLQLNRSADTLSGGETQRVRLAAQLGSGLTGLLYVLDGTCAGAELGCTSTGIRFPYTAELNFTAVAGNTYNVVVDGFSNSDTGTFHINVTPTP